MQDDNANLNDPEGPPQDAVPGHGDVAPVSADDDGTTDAASYQSAVGSGDDPIETSDLRDTDSAGETVDPEGIRERTELETVRDLLLGPEWERLTDARRRFEDPAAHAAEMAKALPGAVAIRNAQDGSLGEALAPTIERSLQTSVRQNPQAIVDAIFPVMGPAIRRAVADTFLRAIQGLNEALEQSLTLKGLGWRIESWRTGRPYAEVVMLHTLAFRVEQVFLIHRETGLLLQHLQAEAVAGQDPDMVSGMLTAIQDFVKDSFAGGGSTASEAAATGTSAGVERLNSMRVGTMTVWIEHAPRAILAAAIRGTPPQGLRQTMQEALERVSLTMSEGLENFQGDASVFAPCRPDLEPVLVQGRRDGAPDPKKKRKTFLAWLVIAVIVGLLAWWLYGRWADRREFERFVAAVESEPGILVTRTDKIGGVWHVYGLRDPFANDPTGLFGKGYPRLGPDNVRLEMEQHQSSDPKFVLERSRNVLKPPQGIALTFDGGVLTALGSTSNKWLAFARARAMLIAGVTQFNEERVTNTTLSVLNALKQKIESRKPRFIVNTTELAPGQGAMFGDLVKEVSQLVKIAEDENVQFRIELIGHTDSTGAEAKNLRLSKQRADEVADVLVSQGVNRDYVTPLGVGATDPMVVAEGTDKDREANRRVNIRVVLPRR
jgi:outer membrane protein OmpA-like peptidoglycan-associated protein